MRLLDDSDLLVCWGPPPRPLSATRAKQHAYINLIISFWHADFIVGRLSAPVVVGAAAHLFRGEIGREFWQMQGANWKATATTRGRRSQRFVRLVDEGFTRARAAGPATPRPSTTCPIPHDRAVRETASTKGWKARGPAHKPGACLAARRGNDCLAGGVPGYSAWRDSRQASTARARPSAVGYSRGAPKRQIVRSRRRRAAGGHPLPVTAERNYVHGQHDQGGNAVGVGGAQLDADAVP